MRPWVPPTGQSDGGKGSPGALPERDPLAYRPATMLRLQEVRRATLLCVTMA